MGGHGRPADALSMLERSHRRLEQRLVELAGAAAQFRSTDDSSALDVALEVCRFLQEAATRHELDEERSVFPRLFGPGVEELIEELSGEHREHARMVEELAAALEAPVVDPRRLVQVASWLEQAYADHLAREEAELMPRIRDLGAEQLDAIYAEMQARRGR